jgi:hypothetical protein
MPPECRYAHAEIPLNPAAMSPCGVTAHGSPGGPLQFDRLEAALAARSIENENGIRTGEDICLHCCLLFLFYFCLAAEAAITDIPSGAPSVVVDSLASHC